MNIKLFFSTTLVFLMSALLFTNSVSAKTTENTSNYNSKGLTSLDDLPSWFTKSLAREKLLKTRSTFKLKEFNVNKKVKGKLKLVDVADGTWYYNIDIGASSPVECYILSEFDGPANSLYAILDNALTVGIPELNKKPLSSKHNLALGSGVINGTPYLLLDILYVVGEGDQKVSGVLKGLSAETGDTLQICMHNEIGYRKTFFSAFESFVEAISEKQTKPEFFDTVMQFTLNDIPVGYSRERFSKDAEGDIQIELESSILIPVDASSISRVDTESKSWSTPDGALINENVYSIENSALSASLSLSSEEDKWKVDGELQGKEVEYELEYTDWLLSNYGSYLALLALNKSDEISAEYNMWLSDADPSSSLKVSINKVLDNPESNFKMDMGPLEVKFLADDNGVFLNGTMEQGPMKMKLKQLYVKGQPSLP